MGILNIRPVVKGGSKAILGIAGPSGTGKTYSALLVARGMVKTASKVGLLDTENKRGSLYAEILDGPFMIGDLYPPFSPRRYAEAIKEFQDAGVEVLVIDSVTHEWEGEGGCDDIANAKIGKMDNWIGAKR
ncbi:MAG TPA: AAA family ATPase, partial [Puia sp.]